MFRFPPKREEWLCIHEAENGEKCNQKVYKDDGGKILNAENGQGGFHNEPHKHIQRINMLKYRYHQQNYPCPSCGTDFNHEAFPLCPTCFKMECRKCPNRQVWIIKEGVDSQICTECGARGMDPAQVFHSYERNYGREPEMYIPR